MLPWTSFDYNKRVENDNNIALSKNKKKENRLMKYQFLHFSLYLSYCLSQHINEDFFNFSNILEESSLCSSIRTYWIYLKPIFPLSFKCPDLFFK